MIVLADADLERAANAAAYYSMQNARPDLHLGRARLRRGAGLRRVRRRGSPRRSRALRQGAPTGPGTRRRRRDDVPAAGRHRRRATSTTRVAKGARVLVGGHARPTATGRFYEPTVLVDVDHSMAAHDRGDVRADAADHEGRRRRGGRPAGQRLAVRARARRCGRKDAARGEAIARRIEAGAVCVNDAQLNYLALELPMGGWKASGLGSRHGAGGIRKYTPPAVAARHAARAQARPAHVPVQGADHERCWAGHQAAVRARQARLARARRRLLAVALGAGRVGVLGHRRLRRRPPEPPACRRSSSCSSRGRRRSRC